MLEAAGRQLNRINGVTVNAGCINDDNYKGRE
jgi:hypothetical protein